MSESDPGLAERATRIAEGLFRTNRVRRRGVFEPGWLKLQCRKGGYYWISLDGSHVLKGRAFARAEELQPKFIDAMERAGL